MWYCEYCDIEITKTNKNRHLLSVKHQKNIGMNPYLRGKIYKIVCLDENDNRIYIGSTIKPLDYRLKEHKQDKKEYEEGKEYRSNCASYSLLHNCEIELIEDYPCNSEKELKKQEQYHISKNECINIMKAYMSVEERKQQLKEYNQKNKEHFKQYKKEYREKNKEKIKQQLKEYNQKNKEKIKAYKSKVIQCDCGLTYTNGHKTRHFRTQLHQERMKIST